MKQYIIRRLLQMIPVLFGVSIIIYIIFAMAPGNVVDQAIQKNPRITEQKIVQLKHIYHLDQPKIVQYGYWLKDALRGNLGVSTKYLKPVTSVINSFMWNSFILSLASFIVSVLLAIPIGVVSATKQYSVFDSVFTVLALAGISIPSFFLGMLLIKFLR